jgi:hypothetical protein
MARSSRMEQMAYARREYRLRAIEVVRYLKA